MPHLRSCRVATYNVSMPVGVCRLCENTRDLRDSHLLPKALSKLLTTFAQAAGESNTNPITITPSVAVQTSRQVTDYVLCSECEDLLNRNGEKWVVANCFRGDYVFPLRSALEIASPVSTDDKHGVKLFDGKKLAGVNCPKLVHFGAGVFWRAAAHRWSATLGRLNLGRYEGQLRRFVNGDSPWPTDVVLFVSVNSEPDAGANENMMFPFQEREKDRYHRFMFVIPGITFQLLVGKEIPKNLRDAATSTHEQIYLTREHRALTYMERLRRKATPKGSVVKLYQRK